MKKAFTLIELLVVIAIIAVLSTLSIVALSNARAKSRDARRFADIRQIQNALELYFNDQGRYPENIPNSGDSLVSVFFGVTTTLLTKVPKNPTSSQYYSYTALNDGADYELAFATEVQVGEYISGDYIATPNGLKHIIAYIWDIGAWGSCSVSCGGGTQTRSVACINSNSVVVSDTLCTGTKPANSQVCNIQSCGTYSWTYDAWGACEPCDGVNDYQTRSVWCIDSNNNTVNDSYCSVPKPEVKQECSCESFSCGDLVEYDGGPWNKAGEVKDDGGYYKTVEINGKCWFDDNLNVGLFVDSRPTGNCIEINGGWSCQVNNFKQEKYCFDNEENRCNEQGGLYEWAEAMGLPSDCSAPDEFLSNKVVCKGIEYDLLSEQQGLCPSGWHIPMADELMKTDNNILQFSSDGFRLGQNGGFSSDQFLLISEPKNKNEVQLLLRDNWDISGNIYTSGASVRCTRNN